MVKCANSSRNTTLKTLQVNSQDLEDNSQDLQDHLQDIPHLPVHLSGVVLDPQTPKNHPDVPTRTL